MYIKYTNILQIYYKYTCIKVNEKLNDEPGLVNSSPESDGWMIKISVNDEGELSVLMDQKQYHEYTDKLN